jgi:hypothetical protein
MPTWPALLAAKIPDDDFQVVHQVVASISGRSPAGTSTAHAVFWSTSPGV